MKAARLCLLAALILAGCATTRPLQTFASPEEALAQAEASAEAGHWSDALTALEDARIQYPEHPELAVREAQLRERWTQLQADWEDRLLLLRARSLKDELALRERLETAEPGGFVSGYRRARNEGRLGSYREGLLICAQRQQDADLELARECVDLAFWIRPGPSANALREEIARRQAELAEAERAEQARQEAERSAAQLDRAEALFTQGRLQRASLMVRQVLEAEPENERAKVLQARLNAELARQTRLLTDIADRLYTEGKIAEAIRVWETSLHIDPEQPEVRERYERAQRVQDKLNQLRQTSRPGGDEAEGIE